ncbi:MAG: hypothetical protein ACR2N3_15790 [Pyrinomonadaceae bacterium]
MNEATKQFFAKLYLQQASSDTYVDWAIACLEDGLDSKNLRMLASMNSPFYSSEIDEKFRHALDELGISFPNKRELLLNYAKDIALKIVSGEINSIDGLNEIHSIDISLNYPKELQAWTMLDGGYDPETKEWIGDFTDIQKQMLSNIIIREAKKLAEMDFS